MKSTQPAFTNDTHVKENEDNTLRHVMNEAQKIAMYQEAAKYAAETERFVVLFMEVELKTNEGPVLLLSSEGQTNCSCERWEAARVCSHTLALEKLLMKLATQNTHEEESVN